MIITAKRKLTSSVAILCAIMILIGIFPLNLFTVRKAEAASDAKYQSGYIYFDISNIVNSDDVTNKGDWSTIYMLYAKTANTGNVAWGGASPAFTKITDTMYGIDVSTWNNTDVSGEIVFATVNDWKLVNSDYKRTSLSGYNVAGAKGRVFSWNGSSTETIDGHPAFVLTSKEAPIGEYIEKQSLAGKTINFKDMTGTLTGNITAEFVDDSNGTISSTVTGGQVTIPTDGSNGAYTKVIFTDASVNLLGSYNLFNDSSDSNYTAIEYDESTCNTFYYGATEKSDNTKVSYWGAKAQSGTVSAKLYLDSDSFPTGGTAPTIQFNSTSATFSVGSDEDAYSYSILSVQTNDIITVTYNGNKYHFFWSDTSKDMVTISNDIANVSLTYGSSNTIYFDATLSKLSYAGSTTYDATMPMSGDDIYCYLYKNSTTNVKHKMTKLDPVTKGSNTWSDVYYYTLSDDDIAAGYTNIIFFSSQDGEWRDSNYYKASQTEDLTLPKDTNKTCFYADSSDKYIYTNTKRSGYWDKPFTIRDAESGKNSTVVDIKASSFSSEKNNYGSREVNYVNSTFYDYYTDYELNGSNRDGYNGESGLEKGVSHRNWVNFRQFDQALSDYYKNKGVSVNDAIYTGHFQPTYTDSTTGEKWGFPFEAIAETMDLYGWSNYNTFISNNNSNVNSDGTVKIGTDGYYMYATQGIVNSALENGVLKTHDGKAASPYFDEDFLNGNNSKNTKLGEVYNNVSFPFTKKDVFGEGVDYWWYDSASKTLAMQKDTESDNYYLADHSLDTDRSWSKNLNSSGIYNAGDKVSNTYGLFPFNYGVNSAKDNNGSTYNYGYGAKLEFKFRLTDDGKVLDSNGNKVDIKFLFSGDDDVWVYIDGNLALDVGGDHGQVTGMLNFANGKAYVSNVKKSANNDKESGSTKLTSVKYKAGGTEGTTEETYRFYQSSDFTLSGSKTDEHTLVMYYMERGMWESNMKVAFNFPDENQLEVEKQVDTTDVNEMFKDMFNNKSLFTFDIKNLATHYGPKSTSSSDDKIVSFASDFSGNISTKAGSQTIANKENEKAGQSNVFYYKAATASNAEYQKYTESRMATFKADGNNTIDISDMNYLNFKFYSEASYEKVPNYSIYIRLTDANGKVLNGYLSSECLYGSPSLTPNKWHSIKVIFRNLSGIISRSNDADFDYKKLDSISFENTDRIKIWLDDFTFQPKPVVNIASGFQTAQKDIPDYGSAKLGKLEDANGSQYTSSVDNKVYSVSDGQFVLQNKENVIFHNQFRNGSYISLKENLTDEQKNLFDTKWTIYEDNVAISTLKDKTTLYIDDGRTEPKGTDEQQANNNYNGNKPSDPTIVFKSYSDDSDTTPKLKIVYNNKVKTTNLTITKQKSSTSADLTGTYEFYVVFGNVGGIGLGTVTSPKYSLKVGESVTITGIPVGTNYTIHEIDPTEADVSLDKVLSDGTEIGFGNDSITVGGATYNTNSVNGSAGTTSGKTYSYVFQNAKKPTIALTLKKIWSDIPDDVTIPINISVKLLRSSDGGKTWSKVSDSYNNIILDGLDSDGWQKTISGLDEYTDNTQKTKWTYKLVELDSSGDEIAEGNKYLDKYIVSYGAVTSDTNRELTVTNKYNVQDIVMPETGGEGGSPNQFNFVLFGAIAIALAGGLLLLNKKYAFVHIGKSSKEVR